MTLPPPPENWDIERLNTERTEAIAAFGFTERQARFLLEVLIHSGVFVERQYCAFAGMSMGRRRWTSCGRSSSAAMRDRSRSARGIAVGSFISATSRSTPPWAKRTTDTAGACRSGA
jgi:hypothetical protein